MIIMGDINIDYRACSNSKWLNLVLLFDLKQLVTEPTRVTQSSSVIIDLIYTTNPEMFQCFAPSYSLSDHYPICFSRKNGCKISKNEHITTKYRSFITLNESQFLQDLAADMEPFSNLSPESDIDEDRTTWYSAIKRPLVMSH